MAMKKVPLKQANEKNQESEDSDLNDKNEKNGKKVDRQDSGDSSSDSITTAWVRKINASIGEETENSSMETMETMGTMAMYWLYEPMPGNRVYRVDGVNMVDVETMGQPVGLEAVELVPDVGLEVALEVNGDIGNDAAGPAVGLTAAPPHLPGDRMCEPCVFFFSCGCSREQTCPYCHLHYPERLHCPCKAKRERIRKRVAESLVQLGLLQPDTPL
ncbi:unnamed protein product [Cladocopium goreaui]|uniref:C3H1-type domain-containing protein n=1 Tax=Cladocopium goreaui TaxID=2562237 RepID=A0A9P1CY47_9DINO|nr:unnamed protein product [Cladocopium goreaui]